MYMSLSMNFSNMPLEGSNMQHDNLMITDTAMWLAIRMTKRCNSLLLLLSYATRWEDSQTTPAQREALDKSICRKLAGLSCYESSVNIAFGVKTLAQCGYEEIESVFTSNRDRKRALQDMKADVEALRYQLDMLVATEEVRDWMSARSTIARLRNGIDNLHRQTMVENWEWEKVQVEQRKRVSAST
jgi:hypothetical protein